MRAPILIHPGKNRDDDGKPLDLYGYLVNELDARQIKARIKEVGGLGGALKLLNAAREQIQRARHPVPGYLDLAIQQVKALIEQSHQRRSAVTRGK